jgi:hypothetical protein
MDQRLVLQVLALAPEVLEVLALAPEVLEVLEG